ncbi:hypothetical protein [Paenibacillus sp. FSL R10-2771]|uniref:hypothetical protein n=1 Tax=Paenibacillus sp. FSL R10-2771 TaxID=2954693 RepID=UPI0030FA0AC6
MNFNQYVKVRLTEVGMNILQKRHEEVEQYYLERTGQNMIGPFAAKTDEEGYTRLQLREVMEKIGPHIGLGKPLPFEGQMIFLGGDPERKENPEYQVGDRVLVEAKITEVDEGIGDVKVKVGTAEVWLRETQVVCR